MLKHEVVQSSVEDVCTEKLDVTVREEEIRRTGIDVIGDAPWGTHFCQFYQTKEDLIDVLVPYFKAGLENNEFCMWVTSGPLSEEEAKEAMRKAVPNFDRYVERGQIEIVPHTEWYLKGGAFNLQRVLNAWIDKLNQALAEGYDGIRVTGNTAWLEKRDWKNFADYEKVVNDAIGKYRMIAICTYPLDKCGANEVIDVVRNHQFALARRRGAWELIESSELKRTKEALKDTEKKYRNLVNSAPVGVYKTNLKGDILFVNAALARMLEFESPEEMMLEGVLQRYKNRKDREVLIENLKKKGKVENFELEALTKTGRPKNVLLSAFLDGDIISGMIIDITKRKQMEEALRKSEEKFRNIFESANDCMIYLDRSGRILDVNRKAVEVFGGSKKELLGKHFTRVGVLSPRDIPMAMSAFAEALAGKTPTRSIRIKNKKGREIYLEISGSLLKIDNKFAGMLVIARDVTERKKAEERIRESEEKYRNLFENARDVIVTFDLKGNVTSINKSAEKHGFKRDKIIGKNMLKFVSKNYWPRLLRELAKIARGNPVEGEIEIITPRGKKIVEYRSSPIRRGKKVVGFQTILRDITERKQMEERLKEYTERLEEKVKERTRELRESEERYASMVNDAIDSLESGIFILDKNFKVVWINKAVEMFFGVNKDDLIGKDKRKAIKEEIKYVFEDPERFEKTVLATYDNNTYVENFECHVLPTKDRKERFLVHWSIPIKTGAYAGGRIEHYYDITKLKKMEQQLLESERLAAIGELATMVGHDLRNPLQAIENATYHLSNELSSLSSSVPIHQKTMEMLQVINESVNYADRIIRDLQDFSAPKKPALKKININAIVKEALSQVEVPENVELIAELSHLPEIKVDKDMMKRVFLNLALNGIQAMENGGKLKVSTKKTEGFVEVSFKDTGIGMSKENMEKLFSPFFTTKAKGMGIGLPICKRFVDAHGGSIEVESEEGKGSTFTIRLPVQQENGGEKA